MTDFEKVTDYLMTIAAGRGIYALELLDVFMTEMKLHGSTTDEHPLKEPMEMLDIYVTWTKKDEAAFLIYFGNECMKRLEG